MKYGYVRVSSVKQVEEGTSLEAQEARLVANGVGKKAIFADAAVSGGTPWDQRPEGRKLHARLEKGDCVVVSKLDRAWRSVSDFAQCIERFKSRGIDLIVLEISSEPITSNAMMQCMMTVFVAFAEFERNLIRERSAEGKRLRAAQGAYIGGRPRFGYEIVGDGMLEEQAWRKEVVGFIFAQRNEGASLRNIAARVSEKYKRHVAISTIRTILAEEQPAPAEAIDDLV